MRISDWSSDVCSSDLPELRIAWNESGGPSAKPPPRKGFGLTLIEQTLCYELDGSARLEFQPEGLLCRMEFRIAADMAPAPDRHSSDRSGQGTPARGLAGGPTLLRAALGAEVRQAIRRRLISVHLWWRRLVPQKH